MGMWEISVQTYTCRAEKLAISLDFFKKYFNYQALGYRHILAGVWSLIWSRVHSGALGMPVTGSS